jgi:hypothetical protein
VHSLHVLCKLHRQTSTVLTTLQSLLLQYQVTAMLWRVAARFGWTVRRFSATTAAPFPEHVHTMAHTGLLVSRHGPLLATAMLLPQGAAVYEFVPFNWEWNRMSELYKNLTDSVGTLHHFAWRPHESWWAEYESVADSKFSPWSAAECQSKCASHSATAARALDDSCLGMGARELVATWCTTLRGSQQNAVLHGSNSWRYKMSQHLSGVTSGETVSTGRVETVSPMYRCTESGCAGCRLLNSRRFFEAQHMLCRPCLAAHARAGLRVDTDTVQSDLENILEALTRPKTSCATANCRVHELRREWPRA